MVSSTDIEWTKATWNPLQGCKKISPGCENCYIFPIIKRFGEGWGRPADDGSTVRIQPHKLLEPLRRIKQLDIFTNSMSDLFQVGVSETYIEAVCRVMEMANWHRYQTLTKRAFRMHKLLNGSLRKYAVLPHLWWGVSVDNRAQGLPRIDLLRDTPAVVKFLSIEPLLEDLGAINLEGIHWAIVGGEAGPKARPMERPWVESIRDQCLSAGVPFFFKQWGGVRKKVHGRLLDNRTWDEIPAIGRNAVPSPRERKALRTRFEGEYGRLGLHRAPKSVISSEPTAAAEVTAVVEPVTEVVSIPGELRTELPPASVFDSGSAMPTTASGTITEAMSTFCGPHTALEPATKEETVPDARPAVRPLDTEMTSVCNIPPTPEKYKSVISMPEPSKRVPKSTWDSMPNLQTSTTPESVRVVRR